MSDVATAGARTSKNAIAIEIAGVKYTSKTQAIYALADSGSSTGDIARAIGCRYQMVRNILLARK